MRVCFTLLRSRATIPAMKHGAPGAGVSRWRSPRNANECSVLGPKTRSGSSMTSAESGRDSGQDETVPERLVCGTHTGVTQQRRDAGRPRVNVDPQKVKALPDAGLSWRAVA